MTQKKQVASFAKVRPKLLNNEKFQVQIFQDLRFCSVKLAKIYLRVYSLNVIKKIQFVFDVYFTSLYNVEGILINKLNRAKNNSSSKQQKNRYFLT
jgi:hypothetical protein